MVNLHESITDVLSEGLKHGPNRDWDGLKQLEADFKSLAKKELGASSFSVNGTLDSDDQDFSGSFKIGPKVHKFSFEAKNIGPYGSDVLMLDGKEIESEQKDGLPWDVIDAFKNHLNLNESQDNLVESIQHNTSLALALGNYLATNINVSDFDDPGEMSEIIRIWGMFFYSISDHKTLKATGSLGTYSGEIDIAFKNNGNFNRIVYSYDMDPRGMAPDKIVFKINGKPAKTGDEEDHLGRFTHLIRRNFKLLK